jgi:hypothetical protein
LPSGLSYSSSGSISGTPTASGTKNVSIRVSDSYGTSVSKSLEIVIEQSKFTCADFVKTSSSYSSGECSNTIFATTNYIFKSKLRTSTGFSSYKLPAGKYLFVRSSPDMRDVYKGSCWRAYYETYKDCTVAFKTFKVSGNLTNIVYFVLDDNDIENSDNACSHILNLVTTDSNSDNTIMLKKTGLI